MNTATLSTRIASLEADVRALPHLEFELQALRERVEHARIARITLALLAAQLRDDLAPTTKANLLLMQLDGTLAHNMSYILGDPGFDLERLATVTRTAAHYLVNIFTVDPADIEPVRQTLSTTTRIVPTVTYELERPQYAAQRIDDDVTTAAPSADEPAPGANDFPLGDDTTEANNVLLADPELDETLPELEGGADQPAAQPDEPSPPPADPDDDEEDQADRDEPQLEKQPETGGPTSATRVAAIFRPGVRLTGTEAHRALPDMPKGTVFAAISKLFTTNTLDRAKRDEDGVYEYWLRDAADTPTPTPEAAPEVPAAPTQQSEPSPAPVKPTLPASIGSDLTDDEIDVLTKLREGPSMGMSATMLRNRLDWRLARVEETLIALEMRRLVTRNGSVYVLEPTAFQAAD